MRDPRLRILTRRRSAVHHDRSNRIARRRSISPTPTSTSARGSPSSISAGSGTAGSGFLNLAEATRSGRGNAVRLRDGLLRAAEASGTTLTSVSCETSYAGRSGSVWPAHLGGSGADRVDRVQRAGGAGRDGGGAGARAAHPAGLLGAVDRHAAAIGRDDKSAHDDHRAGRGRGRSGRHRRADPTSGRRAGRADARCCSRANCGERGTVAAASQPSSV